MLASVKSRWTARDATIYAVSIGLDRPELDEAWHNEQHQHFRAFPTFPLGAMFRSDSDGASLPWLDPAVMKIVEFDPAMLVHGEQAIFWPADSPLTSRAAAEAASFLRSKPADVVFTQRIILAAPKGSDAVVLYIEGVMALAATGQPLATQISSMFLRGATLRATPAELLAAGINQPDAARRVAETFRVLPKSAAPRWESEISVSVAPNQHLLYRLNGDTNPIHVDTALARSVGFKGPILHGLCTLGIAARVIVEHLAKNASVQLVSLNCRFASPVFPGDKITVRISPAASAGGNTLAIAFDVVRGEKTVLSNGRVTFLTAAPSAKL